MLSNTKGYQRFSRSLGFHRDDFSKLRVVCRSWRDTGKCKAYNKELEVRHHLGTQKEAELRKRATALYAAQLDLMSDLASDSVHEKDDDGAVAAFRAGAAAHSGFSADLDKKEEVIHKLVEELKQEPAYLNWSLDAAVAERMVELGVQPCRYSHRGDLNEVLKRRRSALDAEETQRGQQHKEEEQRTLQGLSTTHDSDAAVTAPDVRGVAQSVMVGAERAKRIEKVAHDRDGWAAERYRIFNSLTPLQRCVVCLLWQRSYRVAQEVVMDVRLTLEKRVTAHYEATGKVELPTAETGAKTATARPGTVHEDALDAYLSSSAFEELVEQEEKKVVRYIAFRPQLGLVDLSALPKLVAHMSVTPTSGVLLARTLAFFTGKPVASSSASAPAPRALHSSLFPSRTAITEKELDLSSSHRADEVVEAIEWVLQVYHREAPLHHEEASDECDGAEEHSISTSRTLANTTALFRQERVRLHGLTLARCHITSADGIVESLHRRHMAQYLYALDLSSNRLWSLRFLLILRAHYAHRLLRLSLCNNPITKKPEYQEQVRTSLPQLTSLDGEPIRRPPLRLPKPWPTSCTQWRASDGTPEQRDQATVLDCVARLLYMWETRRVPHTDLELASFRGAGRGSNLPEEEELNEDNFPHRYLHPSATFSVTMSPDLNFFDAVVMREARSVEFEEGYAGMRLSAVDMRDVRVFEVAMKNSSRNLLAGRPALQRFGRGANGCYTAYRYTLYPDRMEVTHYLAGAVVSAESIDDSAASVARPGAEVASAAARGSRKAAAQVGHPLKHHGREKGPTTISAGVSPAKARFGESATRKDSPRLYVVTLHGTMTWHLPSMKRQECLKAGYTRVMTFTKKVLPVQNREWERLRSPPFVLSNDQLFLYPAAPSAAVDAAVPSAAVFTANTPSRLSRLVVEFGLEACLDGVALVRDVLERCTSPASEYAALQALVQGVLGPRGGEDATSHDGDGTTSPDETAAQIACARAAEAQLTELFARYLAARPTDAASVRDFMIFSVLDGATPLATSAEIGLATATKKEAACTAVAGQSTSSAAAVWASAPHHVSLPLLHAVTAITNMCYTLPIQ